MPYFQAMTGPVQPVAGSASRRRLESLPSDSGDELEDPVAAAEAQPGSPFGCLLTKNRSSGLYFGPF